MSYVNETEKLLSDRNEFVKIDFNPKHKVNQGIRHLLDMEFETKSCLDDLCNYNCLSKDDCKFLKSCSSKPGVMYGLCKFIKVQLITITYHHSVQFCLQMVICNYNLAKFFVPILKQFTINEHTVKDSISFSKEIIDQSPNLFMASCHIQSLFTNIPLDETIEICVDMVFEKKKKLKGMLKRHFKQLLILSVKSSCFLFNDVYYKQIDGVAMALLCDQH